MKLAVNNIKKTLALLPKHRVEQTPMIIFLMVIGAVFEVLGIGLIIPIIGIIASDNKGYWVRSFAFFEALSKDQIIVSFLIGFALLYIIKGIFLSFLASMIGRYTYGIRAEVSNKLMSSYIAAPYEFHLTTNTALLIRNLTTEASALVGYGLTPILVIMSESFVVLFLNLFLLWMEPMGTMVVLISITFLAFAFQKVVSGYSKKLGEIRQRADGLVIQKCQETLGGIKDVKVLGKEFLFAEMFYEQNDKTCSVSGKQYWVSQLPRLYLETIGVLAMLLFIFVLATTKDDLNQIVSIAAAFGLAAFRLLPSANRILGSLNALQFGAAVVDGLTEQFRQFSSVPLHAEKDAIKDKTFTFERSIDLSHVCYRYPNSQEKSLSDISLVITKGESIGIIGKSGAGKSTLSDIILGLLVPTSGEVCVDGVNIETDLNGWQKNIGYVPQDIFLLDDSIIKNIAFGVPDDQINEKKINEVIVESQLNEFVSSLPEGLNTQLGERGVRLSGGQKQRIGIARALYRDCLVLIFDEATSSLDQETEVDIVSAIRGLKGWRTIIVIAHRLSTIEHCDRVIELKGGKIYKPQFTKYFKGLS